MQESLLIFTGVAALATTGATVMFGNISRKFIDEAGAAIGMFLWALFGFGSMNIEKFTECCGEVSRSEPGLAFIAVMMIAVNLVVFLWGATALLDVRDVGAS